MRYSVASFESTGIASNPRVDALQRLRLPARMVLLSPALDGNGRQTEPNAALMNDPVVWTPSKDLEHYITGPVKLWSTILGPIDDWAPACLPIVPNQQAPTHDYSKGLTTLDNGCHQPFARFSLKPPDDRRTGGEPGAFRMPWADRSTPARP